MYSILETLLVSRMSHHHYACTTLELLIMRVFISLTRKLHDSDCLPFYQQASRESATSTHRYFKLTLGSRSSTRLDYHHQVLFEEMPLDYESLPYNNPKKERRIALITTGNSGIGWFTVLNLYLHGFIVYIAGRSKTRCIKSIEDLSLEAKYIWDRYLTAQKSQRHLGELHYLEMDLANLSSVLAAVSNFKNLEKTLNILINSAGIMVLPCTLTTDGFELQLQTNYVAPFLLTTKLIPLMERSIEVHPQANPPRIIYVTSKMHKLFIHYTNLNLSFASYPFFLFTWLRYAIAKTAGIHLMKILALRNPRILCVSVQPGIVMSTNYFAYWTRLPFIGSLFWGLFHIFAFLFGVTVEQGAEAICKCCLDPKLSLTEDNGAYFDQFDKSNPSKVARNPDLAARSWIWTVRELEKRNICIA